MDFVPECSELYPKSKSFVNKKAQDVVSKLSQLTIQCAT